MCFETTEYAKVKIAKTDVVCYKFLQKGKGFHSPIQTYSYKKNVVTALVPLKKHMDAYIHKGYHSFRSENLARHAWNFDSLINKVCKFIIPAGTHYYANRYGEYVSERIMLIDEVVVENIKS